MKNRKEAQEFILNYIDRILPGSENKALYEKKFARMNDAEFDQFMEDLKVNKTRLAIIVPNAGKVTLEPERNFKIGRELGHNFFQRVWIPPKNGIPSFLTPHEYMVITLPLRRQAQLLDKKISIPEDNNSVDNMTGQPTGKSKGSRVSYPEVQVLAAIKMDESLTELLKYRGGDTRGFTAMNTTISRTGTVSLKEIEPYAGGVKASHTLSVMLSSMHLQNNLKINK